MPTTETPYPILYSFRRCPYAMRARLAIAAAGLCVELREIELRNKPAEMLAISTKGTVPVLLLPTGQVIDQSLDIMHWALAQHDPDCWLDAASLRATEELIDWNDGKFKYYLDRYKYADRYPEAPQLAYRSQAEDFLAELETRLSRHHYLSGAGFGMADAAILPFIRQFAAVDAAWFNQAPYPAMQKWLAEFVASHRFTEVMRRYAPWNGAKPQVLFGDTTLTGPSLFAKSPTC